MTPKRIKTKKDSQHALLCPETILPLFMLCFLLNFLSACSKDNDTSSNSNQGPVALQNTWELRSIYGGYSVPGTSPSTSPGNKNIWKFSDTTYQQYANGVLYVSGKYTVTKDTSPATGQLMDALILDKNSTQKRFFAFSNDTLVMYRGLVAADGTIEKYVKVESIK